MEFIDIVLPYFKGLTRITLNNMSNDELIVLVETSKIYAPWIKLMNKVAIYNIRNPYLDIDSLIKTKNPLLLCWADRVCNYNDAELNKNDNTIINKLSENIKRYNEENDDKENDNNKSDNEINNNKKPQNNTIIRIKTRHECDKYCNYICLTLPVNTDYDEFKKVTDAMNTDELKIIINLSGRISLPVYRMMNVMNPFSNCDGYEDTAVSIALFEEQYLELKENIQTDTIVISDPTINIIFGFPLKKKFTFEYTSEMGFTCLDLIKIICTKYHMIYKEEEETATIHHYSYVKPCSECDQTNEGFDISGSCIKCKDGFIKIEYDAIYKSHKHLENDDDDDLCLDRLETDGTYGIKDYNLSELWLEQLYFCPSDKTLTMKVTPTWH